MALISQFRLWKKWLNLHKAGGSMSRTDRQSRCWYECHVYESNAWLVFDTDSISQFPPDVLGNKYPWYILKYPWYILK
jgi:hypothetical protein